MSARPERIQSITIVTHVCKQDRVLETHDQKAQLQFCRQEANIFSTHHSLRKYLISSTIPAKEGNRVMSMILQLSHEVYSDYSQLGVPS